MSDAFNDSLDNAVRIVIQHKEATTFRWLGLIEVVLMLVVFCCVILPAGFVVVILTRGSALSGATDIDLPRLNRFTYRWHDVHVRTVDAQGEILFKTVARYTDHNDAEFYVSSVLEAAKRHALTAVETIGSAVTKESRRWYGGRPLLAQPGLATPDLAWERLHRLKCTRAIEPRRTVIQYPEPATSKFTLTIQVLLWCVGFPLLVMHENRQRLRRTWAALRTGAPPLWTFMISADSVEVTYSVGELVQLQHRINGEELLGFSWAPALSYGSQVKLCPPTLHLVHRTGRIHVAIPDALGPSIAKFLTIESLRRRAERPDLDLPYGEPPPTRCPYCGSLYLFKPDTGCPSCGGHPDRVGVA